MLGAANYEQVGFFVAAIYKIYLYAHSYEMHVHVQCCVYSLQTVHWIVYTS